MMSISITGYAKQDTDERIYPYTLGIDVDENLTLEELVEVFRRLAERLYN